jgi:hypothetical protein
MWFFLRVFLFEYFVQGYFFARPFVHFFESALMNTDWDDKEDVR